MQLAEDLSRASFEECRDAARFLCRRLKERKPVQVAFTVSLLNGLVNNAGVEFQKAFFSKESFPAVKHVLKEKTPDKIKDNLRANLKDWQKDLASKPQFTIINTWVCVCMCMMLCLWLCVCVFVLLCAVCGSVLAVCECDCVFGCV